MLSFAVIVRVYNSQMIVYESNNNKRIMKSRNKLLLVYADSFIIIISSYMHHYTYSYKEIQNTYTRSTEIVYFDFVNLANNAGLGHTFVFLVILNKFHYNTSLNAR